MDVIGFGALNLDRIYCVEKVPYWLGEVGSERQLSLDETRRLQSFLSSHARLLMETGGGSAANTIYALAKMGYHCGFIGLVGKDRAGSTLIRELKQAGISTANIARAGQTPMCYLLLDKTGERTSFVSAPGSSEVEITSRQVEYSNKARILHLSSLASPQGLDTQMELARRVRTRMSLDPGVLYAGRGHQELRTLISRTWILFCTAREARQLTGKPWRDAAHFLKNMGPEIVAIKRATHGSTVLFGSNTVNIPAQPVPALDPTGAGDVYAAGFLAGILAGLGYEASADLATGAAAQSITGYGRTRYPGASFLAHFIGGNESPKDFVQ